MSDSTWSDARRYRAMTAGWKARDKGLPLDVAPAWVGKSDRDWWEAGWRWRDDQLALAEARAELVRLRHQVAELRGGNEP